MKLYDLKAGMNPRRVRIFLAEKGIVVPLVQVDMVGGENRRPDYLAKNPMGTMPLLELDDGTLLAESIAICRYFEELHPEPPLFGRGAKEVAYIEMWNRRLELNLLFPIAHVFRNTHPAMKEMEVPQVPAWADANKPRIAEFLPILDRELANGPFVAGERFTVADITGLVAVDFLKPAKLTVPEDCANVRRWHAEVSARPSARA